MTKKTVWLIVSIFMLSAVPALTQPSSEKDQCLLASKNCTNQVDDIHKRMHKLATEIKKGTRVYSPAELKKLQEKLQEADDLLKDLEKGGS